MSGTGRTRTTLALWHARDGVRHGSGAQRAGAIAVAVLLAVQAALGVLTLLWHVPLALALAHQAVAIVTLVAATVHVGNLRAGALRQTDRSGGRGRVDDQHRDLVHGGDVTAHPA